MDINKIINDSVVSSINDNRHLVDDIIDDFMEVVPDDRKLTEEEYKDYLQRIANIVRTATTISVLSSIHAVKSIEIENANELADQSHEHSTESDDEDHNV